MLVTSADSEIVQRLHKPVAINSEVVNRLNKVTWVGKLKNLQVRIYILVSPSILVTNSSSIPYVIAGGIITRGGGGARNTLVYGNVSPRNLEDPNK